MKRKPKTTPSGASVSRSAVATQNIALSIQQEHSREEDVEATRSSARLKTSVDAIQHLDEQGVLALQCILQHGDKYGYWCTPRKWRPTERSAARLNIDLRKRIVHFLPDEQQRLVRHADEVKAQAQGANGIETILSLPSSASRVDSILAGAVLTITRYLVLLRMGPAGLGRKGNGNSLDPTALIDLGYSYMPQLLALGVSKWLAGTSPEALSHDVTVTSLLEIGYLSLIQEDDLDRMSTATKMYANRETRRMRAFAERGYWSDVPGIGDADLSVTDIAGPASSCAEQKTVDSHLPLPDDYVSEMGRRSLWLIHDLAPNLFTIAQKIQFIWQRTEDPTSKPTTVRHRRHTQLEKLLSSHIWHDSQGCVISSPPFRLRLAQRGKNSNESKSRARGPLDEKNVVNVHIAEAGANMPKGKTEWPPRTFGDIMGLIHCVQLAHLFVVALSTGGRQSEVLDLKRWCVQYARNGMPYAAGRTFKLVQRHDGELRDWVLPDFAVQAIEQQARLVQLAELIGPIRPECSPDGAPQPTGAAHLWAQVYGSSSSDRTAPLLDLRQAFISYARTLGMDTEPGGQNLRPHRFRKTVARLVALALTQAPKILMDVFGHKSIEMTLYYILTDKALQADIEQVSRELRVMRAKEVVEKMVNDEETQTDGLLLGGYGGPAALVVHRAIEAQKERLHCRGEKWGADSAVELAEILTLQGKAWQFVRPGVICTKFPGTESGPCNKSKGHPEPASCQSHCKHRLEEAYLREDVDGVVRDAVKAYHEAGENGEELVQALWAGQIRAHIGRFEDLRAKWMSDPIVRRLVEESTMEEALA